MRSEDRGRWKSEVRCEKLEVGQQKFCALLIIECAIKVSWMNTDLATRTKQFALRVMRLVNQLPTTVEGRAIGNQIMRSATSVGANYPAARRARSRREFIAKLGIVEEEADESSYWLELIYEGKVMEQKLVQPLLDESNEIVSMIVQSLKTAKKKTD